MLSSMVSVIAYSYLNERIRDQDIYLALQRFHRQFHTMFLSFSFFLSFFEDIFTGLVPW